MAPQQQGAPIGVEVTVSEGDVDEDEVKLMVGIVVCELLADSPAFGEDVGVVDTVGCREFDADIVAVTVAETLALGDVVTITVGIERDGVRVGEIDDDGVMEGDMVIVTLGMAAGKPPHIGSRGTAPGRMVGLADGAAAPPA